jgi:nucleoside-diphosphate-sugar epimerase
MSCTAKGSDPSRPDGPARERVHLVVGSSGVAGTGIVRHLAQHSPASEPIVALSLDGRVEEALRSRVTGIACDLLQTEAAVEALAEIPVGWIYYAAQLHPQSHSGRGAVDNMNPRLMQAAFGFAKPFAPMLAGVGLWRTAYYRSLAARAGLYDPAGRNRRILENLLQAVRAAGHDALEHVALLTGGRYYGVHLGPDLHPGWQLPLTENTPRHPGPSWYFDLEDLLIAESSEQPWSYSIHRPHLIIGFSDGAPISFANALAYYAYLMRAQNKALIFTGGERLYNARWEAVDAELIGAQMLWASRSHGAHNQAFNITNGAPLRWAEVWPRLAEHLGMKVEVPRHAIDVGKVLGDPKGTWQRLQEEHDLIDAPLARLFPVSFFNQSMVAYWDVHYDMSRARGLGFTAERDHVEMFLGVFERMAAQRYLPPRRS